MSLYQLNLEGDNRIEAAIKLLRKYEPPEGYFLAFSGGKDSTVIYDLAVKSGVKFDAHYNRTGIDPPDLVYFIREHYPNMDWIKPLIPIWKLVVTNGLPTRSGMTLCLLVTGFGALPAGLVQA